MIGTRDKAKAHAKNNNVSFTSRKRPVEGEMNTQSLKKLKSAVLEKCDVSENEKDALNKTVVLENPTVAMNEVKFGISSKFGGWKAGQKLFSKATHSSSSSSSQLVTPEEPHSDVFFASTQAHELPDVVLEAENADTCDQNAEELATRSSDVALLLQAADNSCEQTVEELDTRSSDVAFLLQAAGSSSEKVSGLTTDTSGENACNEGLDLFDTARASADAPYTVKLALRPTFGKIISYDHLEEWREQPTTRGIKRVAGWDEDEATQKVEVTIENDSVDNDLCNMISLMHVSPIQSAHVKRMKLMLELASIDLTLNNLRIAYSDDSKCQEEDCLQCAWCQSSLDSFMCSSKFLKTENGKQGNEDH